MNNTSQGIFKESVDSNKVNFITKKVIQTLEDLLILHPPNVSNEIELGNFIYEIDAFNLDLGIYKLISNTDTAIHGVSQAINKLSTTQDNTDLITSTGNLFFFQIALEASGVNSQAIVMNGASGFESLDMKYVEFSGNTKYGTLTGIRQGFWSDGFSFNAREGFTLDGSWTGGFTILNTRIINTGGFILGAGASLDLDAVRSNVNANIDTGDVAFDFDFDNFNLDNGFQIIGGRFEGAGALSSAFTGLTDSVDPEKSKKCFFKDNVGNLAKNTRVGGSWKCTTQTTTVLTLNTLTKLAGTTTYKDLQHVTQTTDNALVHNTTNMVTYKVDGSIVLDAGNGDDIKLTIRKWDDSASTYIDVEEYTKVVTNLIGGLDLVEFRPFVAQVDLEENDRIEIWVTNLSDNTDVTMQNDSFLRINRI